MLGRRYLSLQRLHLDELPYHPDLSALSPSSPDLSAFLRAVFREACAEDFESGFAALGKWSPNQCRVRIPALGGGEADVPVEVEQRKKTKDKEVWFARRSTHEESHVGYAELDRVLTTDHSWYEYLYTPDVYDGNLLLQWDPRDLEEAASKFQADLTVRDVEMRIYQMFHVLPGPLQDRVFHVVVISGKQATQSHTLQIPVNMASLSDVPSISSRSRILVQGGDWRYQFDANRGTATREPEGTATQQQRSGKKLTEGVYVSLERVCQSADAGPRKTQWDMMTLSDAGGITSKTPVWMQKGKLLESISKDVQYVIEEVGKNRRSEKEGQDKVAGA